MELVNEYIYQLADYAQEKGLNLEISLHTNIRGARKWIISLGEPTGLMKNWWFRTHNESLLAALKELWDGLPYKLNSEQKVQVSDTTEDDSSNTADKQKQ